MCCCLLFPASALSRPGQPGAALPGADCGFALPLLHSQVQAYAELAAKGDERFAQVRTRLCHSSGWIKSSSSWAGQRRAGQGVSESEPIMHEGHGLGDGLVW